MRRAINEFVAYRVDGKTERQLVSDAQDLLLEKPLPSWVERWRFSSLSRFSTRIACWTVSYASLAFSPTPGSYGL
jgi:hypothetical protein